MTFQGDKPKQKDELDCWALDDSKRLQEMNGAKRYYQVQVDEHR